MTSAARATAVGLVAVAAAALLAGSSLLRPGFYDSHDGLLNVHRLFELETCLEDGQIPCRWVPDMGAGYGYPLFNFYPPLSSAVAESFRILGASLLDAIKWTFLLGLLVGALGMFRLAGHFFGAPGGALAAVLYVFMPYQAIDVFVRGALAESWGMALLPWVFLTGHRTVTDPGRTLRHALSCALAWGALLVTHDIVALMAAPFYAAWLLVAIAARSEEGTSGRRLGPAFLAHGLAVGLAAFFVLPLLFELRHVHAETLTSLYPWARFENNFLDSRQLLLSPRAWGYGAIGAQDGMSLFLPWLHGVLGIGSFIGCAWVSLRTRERDESRVAVLVLVPTAALAAFMILPASRVVWEHVGLLSFLQFPWRFLAIAGFGLSFAAGWLAHAARDRGPVPLAIVVVVAVTAITTSWSWFRPSAMHVVPDTVLANEREIARGRHGLFDFLPRGVDLATLIAKPPAPPPPAVHAPSGVALRKIERTSRRIAFEAEVPAPEPAMVRINSFDFPGWTLEVDGLRERFATSDDPLGRLHVEVAPGTHAVVARFENTPIRSFGNAVSLLSILAALAWTAAIIRSR